MKAQSPNFNSSIDNPEGVYRNQLNNSKAKMQFSFGQSSRFTPISNTMTSSPPKYYDLPNLWQRKGVSIGRSSRINFGEKNFTTPNPNKYNVESSFGRKASDGVTMGLGRNSIKFRNLFHSDQSTVPQPASYSPKGSINSRSCTMGKRLNDMECKWIKNVPGPGNYSFMQLTNSQNKKAISKYISSQCSGFSRQKRSSLSSVNYVPGPGQYQMKSQSFDESLFEKPYACKFGTGERQTFGSKSFQIPGPGTYKAFSEFTN